MSSNSNYNQQTTAQTQSSSTGSRSRNLILISILTAFLAFAITLLLRNPSNTAAIRRFWPFSSASRSILNPQAGRATVASTRTISTNPTQSLQGDRKAETKMPKTPVYFLSHGGPSVMYDVQHPAYSKLAQIGREITTKVKPRAVVVFSAHWQASKDTVQVNTAEITDLIYDFYGFPDHYYKEKYPNVGSQEVAGKVLDSLKEAGIKAEGVKRGLDHGVWASFKCAFEPDSNPLNVPIVQVSLFKTEDPIQHYRLGQAVSKLREENILIIVSGMAVHNLRDMMFSFGNPTPLPYTVSFDEALKDAVTTSPDKREKAMADLLKRPDARQAHPFFDHLLPIHIGAGAAGDDVGVRLWTLKDGSMSWAQYRFGELESASVL